MASTPLIGLDVPAYKSGVMARGARCDVCPLARKPLADTHFPAPSDKPLVALVSRSPGPHDASQGEPFAGPSGKLVDAISRPYGYTREDLLLTNVVLCRTDKPTKEAISACAPRLANDIANADTVICGGTEAVRHILKQPLEQARGLRHGNESQKLVATYNPAFALREPARFQSIKDDWRRAFTEAPPFTEKTVHVCTDIAAAREALEGLRLFPTLAIDIETTGLAYDSKLVSIGFGFSPSEAVVIAKEVCQTDAGLELLSDWFRRSQIGDGHQTHVYQNGKFDCKILREHGINAVIHHDTMLMSYALDERGGVHSLDYQLQNELDWPYYEPPAVKAGKKNGFTKDHNGEPFTQWGELYHYNGLDCIGTWTLFPILASRLAEEPGSRNRYEVVLIPAANAFTDVERYGITFDVVEAKRQSVVVVGPRLETLSREASALCVRDINLNSPKQVGEWLYGVQGIPDPKLTKDRSWSTDAAHRTHIAATTKSSTVARFIDTLGEFKELSKLRSNYLDGLSDRTDVDGRLRCNFLLHGTETGRLSSASPNLQNIPRTSDGDISRGEGRINIRKLFVASPGHQLIQADYSQAELRTVAVMAQDEFLLSVYAEGKDLHDEMATALFGRNYTKQQRVVAKTANFGVLYGIEEWYFAQLFGYTVDEARRIIERWWSRVPQVRTWADKQVGLMRSQGYVETAFGHRRRFPLITKDTEKHAVRQSINTPVQGTPTDFTTLSVVELVQSGVVVCLAVHDSVLVECRSDNVIETARTVKDVMESIPSKYLGWNDIPFSADCETGSTWGTLETQQLEAA